MIFNFFKRKQKLHLRDVLQIAILIEQQGVQFYGQLAQMSSDIKVKELCVKLACDEASHKKLFEDMLSRWPSLPVDQQYLNSYIQELKNNGLFSDMPFINTSVENLLKYAIVYEDQTVDFYQSLERKFPELWKQAHIHQIVMVERGHSRSLKSLI